MKRNIRNPNNKKFISEDVNVSIYTSVPKRKNYKFAEEILNVKVKSNYF